MEHAAKPLRFPKKDPIGRLSGVGFARMLQLGSRFVFYALTKDARRERSDVDVLLQGYAAHVRPGKFMPKARVQLREKDGRLLYECLVLEARRQGLAGATVLRGIMGLGTNSRVHTAKIERLSEDLPIIVELVDTQEKLEQFLAGIEPSIREGLITLEKARIRFYRAGQKP